VRVRVRVRVQAQVLVQVPTQPVPPRYPSHGRRRRQTAPWRTAVRLSQWRVWDGWGVGLSCSS
jgi:hypothetical protein